MAEKHGFRLSSDTHHHPHDPSHVIEWVVLVMAAAFAVTMVVALAFGIGKP